MAEWELRVRKLGDWFRTWRTCTHGGDPWTHRHVRIFLGRTRVLKLDWGRSLWNTRPCGFTGHPIHRSGVIDDIRQGVNDG